MARPLGRYSMTAILLHWLMAALICVNLWLGFSLGGVRGAAARGGDFAWHAAIGLTLLALALVRVGWRLAHPPPPEAPGRAHWQKSASNALHLAFYVFLLAMPLSGWLLATTNLSLPHPRLYAIGPFAGAPMPHFPFTGGLTIARRRGVAATAATIHRDLAFIALALIGAHLLGVLRRQLFDPNPVLPRMLPFSKRRQVKP
jgi:cytochrome b561